MSLKKILRIKGTLAFRLTFWYSLLFSLSALVTFLTIYLLIRAIVYEQTDHSLLAEVKEFSIMQSAGGLSKLKEGMLWEVESEGAKNIFLRIFSDDGQELSATDMSAWRGLQPADRYVERLKLTGANHVFETLRLPDQAYPTRVVSGSIGNGLILQFGQSSQEDDVFLEIVRDVFIPSMAAVTFLAALIGWFMARNALAGVEQVTRTALQISKGNFEHRVTVKDHGAEIDLLATAFNHMLNRINVLFREMKEINNHIAHDLRSPITRMRAAAEMALTTVMSPNEGKAATAGMIEDCDRLLGMINTMLDIAEAEAGMAEPNWGAVNIGQVIHDACALFMPVAEDKDINMITETVDDCMLWADARMLQRLVGNLLDNALKYTPPGGTVSVLVQPFNEQVLVRVNDTGIGISEKDLPNIFDKFYRCDRSRGEHGSGLGLSLAKAIVAAHHGTIDVDSRPGEGSVFTVSLPCAIGLEGPYSGLISSQVSQSPTLVGIRSAAKK